MVNLADYQHGQQSDKMGRDKMGPILLTTSNGSNLIILAETYYLP
jgi:hypothetical protein